jgi:hypothetical protein
MRFSASRVHDGPAADPSAAIADRTVRSGAAATGTDL